MSIPFRYAARSHYYSPWFRRGPPLEDYEAPAPYPMVTVPFRPGAPGSDYPYVRRYPMLEHAAVPAYARTKDQQVLGSMSRHPSSSPSPVPGPYSEMVPRWAHVETTEGGLSPFVYDQDDEDEYDEYLDDDDDFEDLHDVLRVRYGASGAKRKLKPFKAISELFRPVGPSGRTKAEELVRASKRLERELKRSQRAVRAAPIRHEQQGLSATQAMLAVGATAVVSIGIGVALVKW